MKIQKYFLILFFCLNLNNKIFSTFDKFLKIIEEKYSSESIFNLELDSEITNSLKPYLIERPLHAIVLFLKARMKYSNQFFKNKMLEKELSEPQKDIWSIKYKQSLKNLVNLDVIEKIIFLIPSNIIEKIVLKSKSIYFTKDLQKNTYIARNIPFLATSLNPSDDEIFFYTNFLKNLQTSQILNLRSIGIILTKYLSTQAYYDDSNLTNDLLNGLAINVLDILRDNIDFSLAKNELTLDQLTAIEALIFLIKPTPDSGNYLGLNLRPHYTSANCINKFVLPDYILYRYLIINSF